MPLDVIFEILAYLEPLDLLHLARTSKLLRNKLMDRHNAFLWRTARANVDGLPECPDAVAEPLFANLIFCTYCHRCGKPNTKMIVWDMKARFCVACHDDLIPSVCKYAGSVNSPPIGVAIDPIPLTPELQECNIFAVCKVISNCKNAMFYYSGTHSILRSEIEDLKSTLASMTLEERTRYIEQRVEVNKQWRNLIPSLEQFFLARSQARGDQIANIRKARYQSITKRLADLGWGADLQKMSFKETCKFCKLPVVDVAKPLTERAWNKGLPALLKFMEGIREGHLEKEHLGVLKERLKLLAEWLKQTRPSDETQPPAFDIALGVPEVRAAIDIPIDVDVTLTDLARCGDAVAAYAAWWLADQRADFASIVERSTAGATDPHADLLSLAIARFECTRCGARVRFPQVLAHRCVGPPGVLPSPMDLYTRAVAGVFSVPCRPIRSNFVLSDAPEAEYVIRLCGQDPQRATLQMMKESTVRLACKRCDPPDGVGVMTWISALHPSHLSNCQPRDLYVLPNKVAEMARQLEQRVMGKARRERMPAGVAEAVTQEEQAVPVVHLLSRMLEGQHDALDTIVTQALQDGSAAFFDLD